MTSPYAILLALVLLKSSVAWTVTRSKAFRVVPCASSVSPDIKPWSFPTKIQQQLTADDIIAVRVSHALFATDELAGACLAQVKAGADFNDLAASVSACEVTRDEGGVVGWVGLSDEHLDEYFPRLCREAAFLQKPGDVVQCRSAKGTHLVKVDDIMTKLRPKTAKAGGRRLAGMGNELPSLTDQLSGQEGIQPTYFMETMGCQMNFADTERIAGQLEAMGMRQCEESEKSGANLIVLNTCSIRDHAEQKVYSYLGPHAIRKRRGDPVAIVVAGCVAQQEGEKLLRRVPEIDLVMGPQYSNRIGSLLEDVMNGHQLVATEPTHIMEDLTKPNRASTVTAWVNVIYGCNEHCTYCVVPATRGVEQSRPLASVVHEVQDLVSEGYPEVTLLGQNIDAWGRDMEPKQRFADLLAAACAVPGIQRVRFVTSHPRYMSPRVIDAVAAHDKAMNVFHIPFQSGDNDILKAMRRGYTREKYLALVERIRSTFKEGEVAITADLIVGFPGETEAQFQNTLALLEAVKFDACMTAAYSPRPTTEAATWVDQVTEATKQDRLKRAHDMVKAHAMERSMMFLDKVEEVLVEKRNIKNPLQVMGRTRLNRQVFFEGDIDILKGKTVMVKITEVFPWCLSGEQVSGSK